jgi:hypothetical protein
MVIKGTETRMKKNEGGEVGRLLSCRVKCGLYPKGNGSLGKSFN